MLDPKYDMYTPYRWDILERTDFETETIFKIKYSGLHFFDNLQMFNCDYILREILQNKIIHNEEFLNLLWHIYNIELLEKGYTKHNYYNYENGTYTEKKKPFAIYQFAITKELLSFIENWQKNTAWETDKTIYEDD